jgi:hypothetical protein
MNKRDPYQRLWINKMGPIPGVVEFSFNASATSGIGLFLFIYSLRNRSLSVHPQPLE